MACAEEDTHSNVVDDSPSSTPKISKVKNHSTKSVTFSPQLTSVEEYNSPYCDPSFMASPDHDAWKECVIQNYANVKLNFIEEAIVQIFHQHFMVCFDDKKQSSLENIHQWFNTMLVGCGQKPWKQQGRKWAVVQSRLSLHKSMWQKRETPITSSSLNDY